MGVVGLAWGGPTTVVVDPRDPAAHATLKSAASVLQPGDTLWLAPGSGPYRETLWIPASGTADEPILVEGNGNEVTGFDALEFENGVAVCPVKYPFVIRFRGERVAEPVAGQFGDGLRYDEASGQLILKAGWPTDGWEISTRGFVVRIQGASYQTYRNLVASGSLNDGFNLHGEGVGLVFANVTGKQNLDEGFSAHGSIECKITEGTFFANDNGLLNGDETITGLEDSEIFNNYGLGLGFNGQAQAIVRNVRVWGNARVQVLVRRDVIADFSDLVVFDSGNGVPPPVAHFELAGRNRTQTLDIDPKLNLSAEALEVRSAPPPEHP